MWRDPLPNLQTKNLLPRPQSLSAGAISRSRTLPRSFEGLGSRKAGLDTLEVDADLVVKMRRWILGLAIGNAHSIVRRVFTRTYQPLRYHYAIAVDFDLDTGPVIEGIYPPLALSASDSENM